MNISFYTFLFLLVAFSARSQCPSGYIGVTGAGCGCLSGCNLSSFGGPNCGGGTSGNCSAGEIAMSTTISVPAGCSYTVSATMANRSGCSASGADSGDKLKVDVSGGSKAFQTGASNATLTDSYTLAGPGNIVVSGTANRQDEIITWTTTSTGCVNCSVSLPIGLVRFDAAIAGSYVECFWETASEKDNDYFIVERSPDGIDFEPIGMMNGSGTTSQPHFYKLVDSSPLTEGISYYRLVQTDFNGTKTYFDMRSVRFGSPSVSIFPNPSGGELTIAGKQLEASDIRIVSALGETIGAVPEITGNGLVYRLSGLKQGLYFVTYPADGVLHTEKVVVVTGSR